MGITLRLIFFALCGGVTALPVTAQQISFQRWINAAQVKTLQRVLRPLPKGEIRLMVWPIAPRVKPTTPPVEIPFFRLADNLPPITAVEAGEPMDPGVEVSNLCAQLRIILQRCGYLVRTDTIDGSGPGYDIGLSYSTDAGRRVSYAIVQALAKSAVEIDGDYYNQGRGSPMVTITVGLERGG